MNSSSDKFVGILPLSDLHRREKGNKTAEATFVKEYLESSEVCEEPTALIADGAYAGEEVSRLAEAKNITLLTTGLLGPKPKEILGQL